MSALLPPVHDRVLALDRAKGILTWPSPVYIGRPIAFCEDILGVAPTEWQARVLMASVTHDKTSVKSGRKLGKSFDQAAIMLLNFCCYDDATSVMVAPTEGQIQRIVYHDLVALHAASGRCVVCRRRDPTGPRPCPHSACIDGEPSPSCRQGIRVGGRRIFGMSPRNADHMRGISGAHQVYALDESPGIDQEIYEACVGNIAATGKTFIAFGNPSSRHGWFYDSHERSGGAFHCITGSSLDSPNVVLGERVVEGLADTKWIEQMRAELSEDDPRWQVDVLGEFPTRDMKRVMTDVDIARVFERAEEYGDPDDDEGDLFVGIDPAGGVGKDTSTIAMRRGWKFWPIYAFQGATDRIMAELESLLTARRRGKERVKIKYDASGRFGKDLGIALGALRLKDDQIEARGLDGRGSVEKDPTLATSGYSRPKDCYWGNASVLLKRVCSIPYDDQLKEDLTFGEWEADHKERDRLKDHDKTEQRKATGRSPDKGDAVTYCLWDGRVTPISEVGKEIVEEEEREQKEEDEIAEKTAKPARDGNEVYDEPADEVFDPYEGAFGGKLWR